jgi:hypothetical protein
MRRIATEIDPPRLALEERLRAVHAQGKRAVLIVHANPHFSGSVPLNHAWPGLGSPYSFVTTDPFKGIWTTTLYLRHLLGFEMVGSSFREVDADHVELIHTLIHQEARAIYPKSAVHVVGISSLTYPVASPKLTHFESWEEFRSSAHYRGGVGFANFDETSPWILSFRPQGPPRLIIDLGGAAWPVSPAIPDVPQPSGTGPIGGAPWEEFDHFGISNPYWTSNRVGDFEYRISEPVCVRGCTLVLDFFEQWVKQPGLRLMAISVSDDHDRTNLPIIDTFALSGNRPGSIYVKMPATNQVIVSVKRANPNGEPAFLGGIRIAP